MVGWRVGITNPIIVVGTPRSGTSLTAGIIARHGVWVGPCKDGDAKNPTGYYESLPFKAALINACGRIVHNGKLAPQVPAWRDIAARILDEHGYEGGPWLVKHSAMYWPVWHQFDPIWVCCRRDADAIARSGKESRLLRNPAAIQPHVDQMEYLRDHHGAHEVWPEDVVKGDYTSIRKAIEAAGLTFQPEIADAMVQPNAWHY